MKTGDLIEWQSDSAIGWLIRKFTGQDVNHSSLLMKFSYSGLADRRFVLEALEDGLEFNLLSRRLDDFNGKVYWYPLKSEYDDRRDTIGSWAIMRKAEHIKYDYWNLFKQVFGKVSVDAKKFFCSEFYHAAMIHAMILLPRKRAYRPGEFAALKIHEKRIRIL
jgi:hypothetical protein